MLRYIEVVDFGPVIITPSPDNVDCTRLTLVNDDGAPGDKGFVDLTSDEVAQIIEGLGAVSQYVDHRFLGA